MTEKITISAGNRKSAEYIQKCLIEFNMKQVPLEGTIVQEPINIVIEDRDNQVIGGINATIIR